MKQKTVYCEAAAFSPDDDGYYCEVFDAVGRTVYQTPLFPTAYHANRDAIAWIDRHGEYTYGGMR